MKTCSIHLRRGLAGVSAVFGLVSGAAAGPVLLVGDAADSHGAQNVYAGLVHETFSNVTNGQVGILALGVDSGSPAGSWLLGVSALLPQPQLVAFANDETIGVIGLSGYALIFVPSPASYVAGGITQTESDLLNSRAGDVANFLDAGGGLIALTQGDLDEPYGFLGDFAPVVTVAVGPSGVCGERSLFDDVTPTAAGVLFGITDTNLDGCCWGNVYSAFPEVFTTLATAEAPACPTINAVASILIDLAQRDTMNRSVRFAGEVLASLQPATYVRPSTPHRSAGFAVLKAPDIPAVLIELGYLSNRQDEREMMAEAWRTRVAAALAVAIDNHFEGQPVPPTRQVANP